MNPSTLRHQPALAAWLRLARIYHKIDRDTAAHLREADLTVAQFDVLAQVGVREGISQQDLADSLLVTKGNVTQLLDRMEARGLLERRPNPQARGNQLFLTAEGRALRERVVPAQEALVESRLAHLDRGEQDALLALLRKLDRSLDQERTEPQ